MEYTWTNEDLEYEVKRHKSLKTKYLRDTVTLNKVWDKLNNDEALNNLIRDKMISAYKEACTD